MTLRRAAKSGQARSQTRHTTRLANYTRYQTAGRAAIDFSAYDTPEIAWARTSYVQPQAMLHDRFLYDRTTRQWTVDRYMEDVTSRYGGIDSILLWQFYPNAGIDARSNFDFIDSLPGGLAAVQQLITDFHAHGVKVLWPIFPWDTGTADFGEQYVAQVAKAIATGADGYNGDTMGGVGNEFFEQSVAQGSPMVAEPEIAGVFWDQHATGWETNFMSWGYWKTWDEDHGGVDAVKTLEVRHLTHICERWAQDRTGGLHHFWFNGIGYESWENVWGVWNQFTPFHAAMLKRMATILRGLDGITSSPDTVWNPHVPFAFEDAACTEQSDDVFVSQFKTGARTLYAMVHRADDEHESVYLSLPCEDSMRFFDLVQGVELTVTCTPASGQYGAETVSGKASAAVPIEPWGFGAILSLQADTALAPPPAVTPPPAPPGGGKGRRLQADYQAQEQAITTLTTTMAAAEHQTPLSTLDAQWHPIPQTLTVNPDTPVVFDAPDGMTTIPGGIYDFHSSNNCIEGDNLPDAVGVQMPWQQHPQREHQQTIQMRSFHMDVQLVTNANYQTYVNADGNATFQPDDDQNWLNHWVRRQIPAGWENHPVRWVSRNDADAYCRSLDKRLPTTWEWQYAAQGTDGRTYPWGNDWDAANVAVLSNERSDPPLEEVGAHPGSASPFGVEDMVGHVYQWTDESCDDHTCKGILRGGSNYYPLGSRWYFPQPGGTNGENHADTPRGDLSVHNTLLLLSESMDRSASIGFRCVADAEATGPLACSAGGCSYNGGLSAAASGSRPNPHEMPDEEADFLVMAGVTAAAFVLWCVCTLCKQKQVKKETEAQESMYVPTSSWNYA